MSSRGVRILLCAGVIAAGLSIRFFGPSLSLPMPFVKYAGSILWGAMVYFIIAIVSGPSKPFRSLAIAFAVSVFVEFSRLYHTPSLDEFRLSLPGQLLLGRVFSLWNIAAYGIGILLAARVDHIFNRPNVGKP